MPEATHSIEDQIHWATLSDKKLAELWRNTANRDLAFVPATEDTMVGVRESLRLSGYGFLRITGHTLNANATAAPEPQHSFIVIGGGSDHPGLRGFAQNQVAAKWNQDFFLFKSAKDGRVALISTGAKGATADLGVFEPSKLSDYYSRLMGAEFVVDRIDEKTNFFGGLMRARLLRCDAAALATTPLG